MNSILVTEATLQKRKEYIKKQLDKLRVSKFDRIYIQTENAVKIEQVRNLIKYLHKKPSYSNLRAGVILEAEKATIEAQNALLKLLEEPPKSALIFLSVPNPKYLLPTITSRCKLIRLQQNLLQTPEKCFAELDMLPSYRAFELAEKYASSREEADKFLQSMLIFMREKYLSAKVIEVAARYANLAKKIQTSRRILASNVNPRQVLENLLLELSHSSHHVDV